MAKLDSKRTIPPSRLPLKKRKVTDIDLIHIEFLFHLAANKPTSSSKASSVPPSPEETSNPSRPLPPTQTPPPYTTFSSSISPHRQPGNIAVMAAQHNLHKPNEKASLTPTMAKLYSKRTTSSFRKPMVVEKASNKVAKRKLADIDETPIESPFRPFADKPLTLFKVSSVPPSSAEKSNSCGPLPPTQSPPPNSLSSCITPPRRQPVNVAVTTAPHNLYKPAEIASLSPTMAKLDSKRNKSSSHKPMDVEKASNKITKRKLADIDDEIHIKPPPSHPVADKPITLYKASSVPPSSAEPSNSSGPLPPTQTPPPSIVVKSGISPHRQPVNVAATPSVDDFRSMYEKSHRNRKSRYTPTPRRPCIPKARPSDQKPPPPITRLVRRPPFRPTFDQESSILSQIIAKVSKDS
jgi:hypothetical protein